MMASFEEVPRIGEGHKAQKRTLFTLFPDIFCEDIRTEREPCSDVVSTAFNAKADIRQPHTDSIHPALGKRMGYPQGDVSDVV